MKKNVEMEKQIDFDLDNFEDDPDEGNFEVEQPKKFAKLRSFVKRHKVLFVVVGAGLAITGAVVGLGLVPVGEADVVDGEASEVVPAAIPEKSEEK